MSSPKTPVQFIDLFRYYKGLPHQMAAIQELGELIPASLLHRSNNWFRVWSQAGKQPEPDWVEPALNIIREFEGLRLEAYRCPAGVWTIGYGTTRYPGPDGGPVRKDDVITVQQAEFYLMDALQNLYVPNIFFLIPRSKNWSGSRIAALASFAYNVGLGALEDSTLRQRLNEDENPDTVVRAELPRWNKADGKVLEGLTRRRAAEVKLFTGEDPVPIYPNPLTVKWYSQKDSATDQAARMCFSSSCAMLLETLHPGTLQGPNGDDQYLKRVQQYGDTTDPSAQLQALRSYGLSATFTKTADFHTLERQIEAGIPVPCGYLHRGPVSAPSGGGHWLVVCGIDKTHVIVHDPFGEANLIDGTTLPTPARYAYYSRKNWGPRWCVEGPNTGWAIIAER